MNPLVIEKILPKGMLRDLGKKIIQNRADRLNLRHLRSISFAATESVRHSDRVQESQAGRGQVKRGGVNE